MNILVYLFYIVLIISPLQQQKQTALAFFSSREGMAPLKFTTSYKSIVSLYASKKNHGKLGIDKWEKVKSPSLENLFDRDGVTHIAAESFPTTTPTTSIIQLLPIMPFESPLFLHAKEFLYIYERRFRELMKNVEINNQTMGRCYISENGEIGQVGSLCRVVEKKQLEDGKGFYIIEAIGRFHIQRMVSTDPYLVAEVEMDIHTNELEFEESALVIELLCHDIYTLLKIYLRVQRLRQSERAFPSHHTQHNDHDDDQHSFQRGHEPYVCFQPAVYSCRPVSKPSRGIDSLEKDEVEVHARHQAFCHACANLLSTEPSILQQIFQSRSLQFQLHGIKCILAEAADELSSLMIEDGLLAKTTLQEVIRRSTADIDDDSDLAPPADYHEVTLDEEIGPHMSAEAFEVHLTRTITGKYDDGSEDDSINDMGREDTTFTRGIDDRVSSEVNRRFVDWDAVDWDSKNTSFQ